MNQPESETPAVTVIIPTYNRSKTIEEAMRSVLAQTFTDFELLIVDDGSTDDTVVKVCAIRDPRVRVIVHEANKGANAARNTGIENARGVYVAFNDSDDEWMPRKLELQMDALAFAEEGYGACYCGMVSYGMAEDQSLAHRAARYWPERQLGTVEGDIYEALLHTNLVSTQTLVVETDIVRAAGGFNVTLKAGQDWELVLRLAQLTKFAFIERPLVLAHLSPDSLTKARWNHARTREFVLSTHYDAIASDRGLLAFYHRRSADYCRHVGDRERELGHLRRAVASQPTDPRNLARLVAASFRTPTSRLSAQRSLEHGGLAQSSIAQSSIAPRETAKSA